MVEQLAGRVPSDLSFPGSADAATGGNEDDLVDFLGDRSDETTRRP